MPSLADITENDVITLDQIDRDILLNLQNDKGQFSVKKFWKLKQCITSKGDYKTSIITDQEVELFADEAIINEYVNEFQQRLSHRKIISSLNKYEEITHKILHECLLQASKCTKIDFNPSEVSVAIHELNNGKAPDSDFFSSEIQKIASTTKNQGKKCEKYTKKRF